LIPFTVFIDGDSLDLEPFSELGLERCKPCGMIACCTDVIDVQRDHGEDVTGAEDVDARVGNALLPPMVDEPCTEEHLNSRGDCFMPYRQRLR
jgi:hypothetical protein